MGTAGIMFIFSEGLSQCIYGDGQCAEYLRVLAPLLPIMYTDTTVDGILKGLDQQVYSMRYNIIDSAMCVVLVLILIPKYSVKGLCRDTFYQRDSKLFLSIHRLSKVLHARNKYHGFDNKARRLRDGFCFAGLLLSAQGSESRADNHNNCQRGGVYSSADAHGSISVQDIIWFKTSFRAAQNLKKRLCAARINDRQRSLSD